MTSSVNMLSKNVFEREIQDVNSRIKFLNEQPYDDETDIRLAQEEVWDLESYRSHLERRIKELS